MFNNSETIRSNFHLNTYTIATFKIKNRLLSEHIPLNDTKITIHYRSENAAVTRAKY
jgi:hypothetical protein